MNTTKSKFKMPTVYSGKVITSISWDIKTWMYIKELSSNNNMTLSSFLNKYFADLQETAEDLDNFDEHFKFHK